MLALKVSILFLLTLVLSEVKEHEILTARDMLFKTDRPSIEVFAVDNGNLVALIDLVLLHHLLREDVFDILVFELLHEVVEGQALGCPFVLSLTPCTLF
jgi:hypothetical protein